jgi:S-adenosylmethionine synthetase
VFAELVFFPLSSSGNLLLELMNWVLSFSVKLRQKSQIFSSVTLLFLLENDGKGNISVSYETKNIVQFKSVVYFILCSVLVGK